MISDYEGDLRYPSYAIPPRFMACSVPKARRIAIKTQRTVSMIYMVHPMRALAGVGAFCGGCGSSFDAEGIVVSPIDNL